MSEAGMALGSGGSDVVLRIRSWCVVGDGDEAGGGAALLPHSLRLSPPPTPLSISCVSVPFRL